MRQNAFLLRSCTIEYTPSAKSAFFLASAVATQEATDDDSTWLRNRQSKDFAVDIRTPRGLGYG
jgi:hypothetical protein